MGDKHFYYYFRVRAQTRLYLGRGYLIRACTINGVKLRAIFIKTSCRGEHFSGMYLFTDFYGILSILLWNDAEISLLSRHGMELCFWQFFWLAEQP